MQPNAFFWAGRSFEERRVEELIEEGDWCRKQVLPWVRDATKTAFGRDRTQVQHLLTAAKKAAPGHLRERCVLGGGG